MVKDTSDTAREFSLTPAQWIWLPSGRTLANTFVLFRKDIDIPFAPSRVTGWVLADSRYKLTVNGIRQQWGPAPSDPRWPEADPVDLSHVVHKGRNTLGIEVLYYGSGDGTWPLGKPGLLFKVEIYGDQDQYMTAVSDETWFCHLDRSRRTGQYRRWFLRALQEDSDLRKLPERWDEPTFRPGADWVPAMVLPGSAPNKPALCSGYPDYSWDVGLTDWSQAQLRPRSVPLLREQVIAALTMTDSGWIQWTRSPEDWFEYRMPNSFSIISDVAICQQVAETSWRLPSAPVDDRGVYATFVFAEQIVGWPFIELEASEGAVVELIWQESHDPEQTAWLDSSHFTWARFVCRPGRNHLETFDFESLRWLQVHIHQSPQPVTITQVGVRRRIYPFPHEPKIQVEDQALQRLFHAAVNTLYNSAQDTVVDGMGRERQQYSGDGGHQLHAIRYLFGETRLPSRFLTTFSQGITSGGYFLDSWPGFDRMARMMTRPMGLGGWGPILDHGVGFVFDCWHHYLETGHLDTLREPYPRLKRFAEYLTGLIQSDGMLPVENLGVPVVWIDHDAYRRQRHKQCAFNLYVAAMFEHALGPIADAFGDYALAAQYKAVGIEIARAAVNAFWDEDSQSFVINRPWLAEEETPLWCDRSLSTAVIYDMCPDGKWQAVVNMLAERPSHLGISYPCNAGWRYDALAKHGRVDVVVHELRSIWASMPSVALNNSIQEYWTARADSADQWSHSAMAPLNLLFMGIFGLQPARPGFLEYVIRPQVAAMGPMDITAYTVCGPTRLRVERSSAGYEVRLTVPPEGRGELLLPPDQASSSALPVIGQDLQEGLVRLALTPGQEHRWVIQALVTGQS